ncbi:hypothetical protein [Shewanella aegiceratis]|uniref:hypothetical protein n=1 Tax=Shewanella aegiceratis TaxID=2864203 RepID=UPI001C6599B8|nr:hypothetical protein [Shewanella aegiceratis]QYJ83328.1 hypothetical protein K0H80_04680 [Shewanella aegiceratis]
MMIKCSRCNNKAEYVLVDYRHEIVDEGEVFCGHHAFDENREKCPCCYDYWIEVYDGDTKCDVKLLPTYPQGTLDSEGCCSEHP